METGMSWAAPVDSAGPGLEPAVSLQWNGTETPYYLPTTTKCLLLNSIIILHLAGN